MLVVLLPIFVAGLKIISRHDFVVPSKISRCLLSKVLNIKAYSESIPTSKMEHILKIVYLKAHSKV